MYGFPHTYLHKEQTADLKIVADAMFAHGVNHHVYHGMPYNPIGSDTNTFFATTYFGPNGSLSEELPAFNSYIEKVSKHLQTGKTYSDVAVYIPHEDGIMKGAYPPERQRVWVWGEYELRYIDPPKDWRAIIHSGLTNIFYKKRILKMENLKLVTLHFPCYTLTFNLWIINPLIEFLNWQKSGLPVCIKKFT